MSSLTSPSLKQRDFGFPFHNFVKVALHVLNNALITVNLNFRFKYYK